MPDLWSFANIAAKWALYVGVLGASGTVFCALIFRLEHFRDLAIKFAFVGLIAACLGFALKGVALTGDASGMADREMLGLLWTTNSGTALVWQLAGLLLVLFGLMFGTPGLLISGIGGMAALYSFAITGHIADHDSWLLTAALVLHLAGAAFWIGILTPLRRLASDTTSLLEAASVGHQFGRIASIVVPLLLLAGLIMGYELVGPVSGLTGTGYGRALLVKVALVAGLLALAAANKLRFVPGMGRRDSSSAQGLTKSIAVEWLIVLLILAATATFTSILTLPK